MVLLLVLILGLRYVGTFGAVRCILPGRRQCCRRTRLSSTHPPRPTSHTHRFKPLSSSAWWLRSAWQTASKYGLVGLPYSSLWLLWLSIEWLNQNKYGVMFQQEWEAWISNVKLIQPGFLHGWSNPLLELRFSSFTCASCARAWLRNELLNQAREPNWCLEGDINLCVAFILALFLGD